MQYCCYATGNCSRLHDSWCCEYGWDKEPAHCKGCDTDGRCSLADNCKDNGNGDANGDKATLRPATDEGEDEG